MDSYLALSQQNTELRLENNELRQRAEQAEAEAGAMREALDSAQQVIQDIKESLNISPLIWRSTEELIKAALAPSAGKEYADRMRVLEKALGIACNRVATNLSVSPMYYNDWVKNYIAECLKEAGGSHE